MTKVAYEDLTKLADAELDCLRGLGKRVDEVLDSARINADDTKYLEKNEDQSWEYIAMSTIEEILSFSSDKEVQDWFIGHGVRF